MKDFIPAASFHFLTPFYDPFMRIFCRRVFKKIAEIIDPKPHQHILDLGCGPGNLILEFKAKQPQVKITGLDIDPKILQIADQKLKKAQIEAKLIEASGTEIPDGKQYDIVVSTLMIHHLQSMDKKKMVGEAYRVLKTGGKFYLYDFSPPKNWFGKILAPIYGLFEEIDDGVKGKYPVFLKEAGFKNVRSVFRSMLFEMLEGEK